MLKFLLLALALVALCNAQLPTLFRGYMAIENDPEQSGIYEAWFSYDAVDDANGRRTSLHYLRPAAGNDLLFLREVHLYNTGRLFRQCPNTCNTFDSRTEQFPLINANQASGFAKDASAPQTISYVFPDGSSAPVSCQKYNRAATGNEKQVKHIWIQEQLQLPCRVEFGDGTQWTFKVDTIAAGGGFNTFPAPVTPTDAYQVPVEDCTADCKGEIDIVFVLDKSGSLKTGWGDVIRWVRDAANRFEIGDKGAWFAFAEYNDFGRRITNGFLTNKQAVLNTLNDLGDDTPRSFTCIGCGMRSGTSYLYNVEKYIQMCKSDLDCIERNVKAKVAASDIRSRPNVPDVMIVLTDGVVNRPDEAGGDYPLSQYFGLIDFVKPNGDGTRGYLTLMARYAIAAGATPFAIAITGKDQNGQDQTSYDDLLVIADGDTSRIFQVDSAAALETITSAIVQKVCDQSKKCSGNCNSFCGCNNFCSCPTTCDDKNPCTKDICPSPQVGCKTGPNDAIGGRRQCQDDNLCIDTVCVNPNNPAVTQPTLTNGKYADPSAAPECQSQPSKEALECKDDNVCTDEECLPDVGCVKPSHADQCVPPNICITAFCNATRTEPTPGLPIGCQLKADPTNSDDCTKCQKIEVDKITDLNCKLGDENNICLGRGTNDALIGAGNLANRGDCPDLCLAYSCNADGKCVQSSASRRDCDDQNACTADDCDANTGNCTYTDLSSNCDSLNQCNVTWCDAVEGCQWEALNGTVACDDLDPCTIDECDPTILAPGEKCVHTSKVNTTCYEALGNETFCKRPLCRADGECDFTFYSCPPPPVGECAVGYCDEGNKTCVYVGLSCNFFTPDTDIQGKTTLTVGVIVGIIVAIVVAFALVLGAGVGLNAYAQSAANAGALNTNVLYSGAGTSGNSMAYEPAA